MNNIFFVQFNSKHTLIYLTNICWTLPGILLSSPSLSLTVIRTLTLDARTVAIAWGILNDSYLNSRTLTYEPSVLCCSCIYVASQCSMVPYVITESRQGGESTASPPAEGTASVLSRTLPQQWWELFGVPSDQLWGCIDYLVGLQDSTSTLPTPPLV